MRSHLFCLCVCHFKNYLLYLYLYLYFLYFGGGNKAKNTLRFWMVFWRGKKPKNTVRLIESQSPLYVVREGKSAIGMGF